MGLGVRHVVRVSALALVFREGLQMRAAGEGLGLGSRQRLRGSCVVPSLRGKSVEGTQRVWALVVSRGKAHVVMTKSIPIAMSWGLALGPLAWQGTSRGLQHTGCLCLLSLSP